VQDQQQQQFSNQAESLQTGNGKGNTKNRKNEEEEAEDGSELDTGVVKDDYHKI